MPKLVVTARCERGFIRAGRHFPPTPTEVDVDHKTAAILRAEPMLVVVEGGLVQRTAQAATLQEALEALPEAMQRELSDRISGDIAEARAPLKSELEKSSKQLADARAEIEHLKARVAELEAAPRRK